MTINIETKDSMGFPSLKAGLVKVFKMEILAGKVYIVGNQTFIIKLAFQWKVR